MRIQPTCTLLPACALLIAILFDGQAHCQSSASPQAEFWQGYQAQTFRNGRSRIDAVVVDIGTIGLMREVPDNQELAYDASFQPILNADTLQGSMQFGTKAMLDFLNVSSKFGGTDLQLGYFGINSLDGGAQVNSGAVNSYFFNALPASPPTSFDFNYSSNLYSGEANLRFASRYRIRPLVGLRYFKLEDTYDVYQSSSSSIDGFFSLTNNSLFGGQLGLEGDIWQTRHVNLYGFGKAGAMHNEIEGSATAANFHQEFSDSTYATLVDAGVGAIINFAGPLSFRVGYRSLFASSLALGIDQNQAVSIYPGPDTLKFNSQHWHGVDLAAVFQF
jgi:hypothetical protein